MAKNKPGGGRKPTPSAIKIARGTDKDHRNQRFNELEPDVPTGAPVCPAHLDETAKAEWEKMCGILTEMGVLSPSYQRSLELYVRCYSNYRQAMEMVDRVGQAVVVKGKDGSTEIRRNPFSVEAHKYHEECYRWLTEFGLTPSSKTRLVSESKIRSVRTWNRA